MDGARRFSGAWWERLGWWEVWVLAYELWGLSVTVVWMNGLPATGVCRGSMQSLL